MSLKDVEERVYEVLAVDSHMFGNVDNAVLGWQERLWWFAEVEGGDKIRVSWFADGNVSVYIVTETQFGNLINNSMVYCEYYADFYHGVAEVSLVKSDVYYVVVANQPPMSCRVKLYEVECNLIKTYVKVERRSIDVYPFQQLGIALILIGVWRFALLLHLKH